MEVTITWQTIITAAAVLGALGAIAAAIVKAVRWWDKQNQQSKSIKHLKEQHDKDLVDLRADIKAELANQRSEMQLIMYGVLASLKGLSEQGCNGPVTETIDKIEKYLNQKAHSNDINI